MENKQLLNWLSEVEDLSDAVLDQLSQISRLRSRYLLNNFSTVLDDDSSFVDSFPHLSKVKILAAVGAFQAIETSLGDTTTGQQTHLIRMQR